MRGDNWLKLADFLERRFGPSPGFKQNAKWKCLDEYTGRNHLHQTFFLRSEYGRDKTYRNVREL